MVNIMQKQNDFETACKNLTEEIGIFKEEIVSKCIELQGAEWSFDKGTTKVCKADENGKKKRCKVGITYKSMFTLTNDAAIEIWQIFKEYFDDSNLTNVERLTENEEMGRYVFSAKNELDEVECVINTPGEWNIPLISITGYVGSRYRSLDID